MQIHFGMQLQGPRETDNLTNSNGSTLARQETSNWGVWSLFWGDRSGTGCLRGYYLKVKSNVLNQEDENSNSVTASLHLSRYDSWPCFLSTTAAQYFYQIHWTWAEIIPENYCINSLQKTELKLQFSVKSSWVDGASIESLVWLFHVCVVTVNQVSSVLYVEIVQPQSILTGGQKRYIIHEEYDRFQL